MISQSVRTAQEVFHKPFSPLTFGSSRILISGNFIILKISLMFQQGSSEFFKLLFPNKYYARISLHEMKWKKRTYM